MSAGFLGVLDALLARDEAGSYGTARGMLPETHHCLFHEIEEGEVQEKAADRIKAEEEQRVVDREDTPGQAVDDRVDRPEDPGNESGVPGDKRAHLLQRYIGVAHEIHRSSCDTRDRWTREYLFDAIPHRSHADRTLVPRGH